MATFRAKISAGIRPPASPGTAPPRPPLRRRPPGRAAFGRVVGRPGRWLGGVAVSGRLAGRRGSVRGRRLVRPPRRGEPVVGAGVADGPGRWRDGTGVRPGRRPGPGRTPARRRAITPLPVTNPA